MSLPVLMTLFLVIGEASTDLNAANSFEDHPCGDARMVSDLLHVMLGSNPEVVDVETVILDLSEPIYEGDPVPLGRLRLRLAGTARPTSQEVARSCASELRELIEGKDLTVLSAQTLGDDSIPPGLPVILMSDRIDLNRRLLERGCARFTTRQRYELDWWTECNYQRAERAARLQPRDRRG